MTKKWIAINLLLLATAALLGWQLRQSILQFDADNNPAKIQPSRSMKPKVVQEKQAPKPAAVARNYNAAEFMTIPDKNLFSESRSRDDKAETAPPEPPPLTQKPVLVAVTIIDNQQRASIIDPTSQEKVRRAQIKKIGDVYQGYTITEISADRMVLESGTRREIIPLREGAKKSQQGKTPILSTRIVPFGGGATTGGAPVVITGGAIPVRTAVAPVGTTPNVTNVQQTTVQQVNPTARGAQPNTVLPPTAQPVSGDPPAAPAGSGTGRVIRTPFGDVVRPAR
jgi:hypothetical protein